MKSIKYIVVIGIMAASLAACKKQIDLKPEFQLDGTNPLTSLDQVEQALTGVYAGFRSGNYYSDNNNLSGAYGTMPDMMSDNLTETGESLANFRQMVDWLYASDNADIAAVWATAYNIISRANIVLRDVDQFASVNQARVNRLKGQALAIRAHVHFDIFRYWGATFNRNYTGSDSLGIPYVKTFDVTNKPGRLTAKATYDEILNDLSQAATLLSTIDKPVNSSSSRAQIDLAGVRAIQARVNLYAGQWNDAITAATQAISLRPIASRSVFPFIYNDQTVQGVIWSVQFDPGQGGPGSNVYFVQGNRSSFRPSTTVLSLYDQLNDIRYSTFFVTIPSQGGVNRVVSNKYIGKGSLRDGTVNFKVYRAAEMYLIRAEAYAQTGQSALASADLNTVRRNRINGYVDVSLTGAALMNAIEAERRKELWAEGHRFFDLKRTTRSINRSSCGPGSGSLATRCTLPKESRSWSWPIPFNEIRINENISQNAGY